jgi:hypothetical protein
MVGRPSGTYVVASPPTSSSDVTDVENNLQSDGEAILKSPDVHDRHIEATPVLLMVP